MKNLLNGGLKTLYRRYCANIRQPSLQMLFDIARVLKVNPKELLNA
jgi:hypothetical protein